MLPFRYFYVGCLTGLLCLPSMAWAASSSTAPAYQDATLPIEVRVEDLLARMTIFEKVGQMALVERKHLSDVSDIRTYGLGALLSGSGSRPATNTVAAWSDMTSSFQAEAANTRLGIPLLYGVDAVHGQAHVEELTIFPHAIGLAATRDETLVYDIAKATAIEMAATGANWNFAPNLDMPHDHRWGRVYETYGVHRSTVMQFGEAFVAGTQYGLNGSPSAARVLATPKHYLGLGSMEFGTSQNPQYLIDQGMTAYNISRLQQEYAPPFAAAIDAGAMTIMAGLNSWGKKQVTASYYLLTKILKERLGFQGFVVSDWYGVYALPGTKYQDTVMAINAGIDMVMLPEEYERFVRDMIRAYQNGDISAERIDDAVRRILRAKFTLGLFDVSRTPVLSEQTLAAHGALARKAVAESVVVLKNERDALPLPVSLATTSAHTHQLLVAGSIAHDTGKQAGAWTIDWQGVTGNVLPHATSILAGIEATVSSSSKVTYVPDVTALASTTRAAVGIVVVGEAPYAEGFGDRHYPILPYEDILAITTLRPLVDTLVVVMVAGRPLLIEHELPLIDVLAMAWLPGQAGEGVADVLFGNVPSTGRLPLPWPLRSEQLPFRSGARTYDGTAPLYELGFGLTTSAVAKSSAAQR